MTETVCDTDEFAPDAVPRVCEGVNIMEEDITPDEGFLLSRLDGRSSVDVLCSSSGLGKQKTMDLLKSLNEKGVVAFKGEKSEEETGKEEKKEETKAEKAGRSEEKARQEKSEGKKEEVKEEEQEVSSPGTTFAAYDLPDLIKLLRKKIPRGEDVLPIVDSIFVHMEGLSYYELLGIPRDSDKKAIRKAYFIRSKSFHPDKFYRQVDKEFKRKLQEIFKQINKGYRTLSDDETRAEYDSSLAEEEEYFGEEAEAGEAKQEPTTRERGVKGESSPWKKMRVPQRKPVEEKVRERPKKEEEKKPSGPKLKLGLKGGDKPKSMMAKKIEQRLKEKGTEGPIKQAEKFYQGAMIEKDRGNFQAAKVNLKLAIQYAPGVKKFKEALADIDEQEEKYRGRSEFKKGMDAQDDKDLNRALEHYKQALRLGFESPKMYHKLAELMMELERNYERARSLLLKAIELEEGVADYHMALARAYKGLGQKAAAMVQLEKVLKLEPKNKIASKELKSLKKG